MIYWYMYIYIYDILIYVHNFTQNKMWNVFFIFAKIDSLLCKYFWNKKKRQKKGSRGVVRILSRGGLHFFLSRRSQHPLGPKNSLKFIDFTGPGGCLGTVVHWVCHLCIEDFASSPFKWFVKQENRFFAGNSNIFFVF